MTSNSRRWLASPKQPKTREGLLLTKGKMKITNLFYLLLLTVFSFAACETAVEGDDNQPEPACNGFTQEELAFVGTLHNQYVTEAYRQVDFQTCDDCRGEIAAAFVQMEVDRTATEQTVEELIAEASLLYEELVPIQFDIRSWANHPFSATSYAHLSALMAAIDGAENYAQFLEQISALQLNVNSDATLSCFEVEMLTGTIEVARNSMQLWMPRQLGGLDYYSLPQGGNERAWSWRSAVKADATASAGYFTTLGTAAAAGLIIPGSNAAILGGWALSSGIMSAWGGLGG